MARERLVILADVSDSMDRRDAGDNGCSRRIDVMRRGLESALASRPDARLVAFQAQAWAIQGPHDLPLDPDGGTCVASAVRLAAQYRPDRTLLISDGSPYSEEEAFDAREHLPGRIDTLYCGPDHDEEAIDFMRRFARGGCMTQGRDENAVAAAIDIETEVDAALGRVGNHAQLMAHLPKLAAGLEQVRGQVHTLATHAQIERAERALHGVVDSVALGWMDQMQAISAATELQRQKETLALRGTLAAVGERTAAAIGDGFAQLGGTLAPQLAAGTGDPRMLQAFDFQAFAREAALPAPAMAPAVAYAPRGEVQALPAPAPEPRRSPAALPAPISAVPAPQAKTPQLPPPAPRRGLVALLGRSGR
jgi:hypothetical protein